MYCSICGHKEDKRIFMMCKDCFYQFANISILDEDYDKYKNLIRILLSYYISLSPVSNPIN